MTYHDALMSQLLSLLSCAATVRGRLHSVQVSCTGYRGSTA